MQHRRRRAGELHERRARQRLVARLEPLGVVEHPRVADHRVVGAATGRCTNSEEIRFPRASSSAARRTLTGTMALSPESAERLVSLDEELAEAAGHGGEGDVVDRSAEGALDRLEVLQTAVDGAKRRRLPIGPLRLVCGAATTSFRTSELGERLAAARGLGKRATGAPRRRRRRARRAGAWPGGASARRRPVAPGGLHEGERPGIGVASSRRCVDVDRADAVDHAVMGLADERPAAAREALEQDDLPQRTAAVEPVRPELRRPLGSSASPPGPGSAARRTWRATSKASSTSQAGHDSPPVVGLGQTLAVARHRGEPLEQQMAHGIERGGPPPGSGSKTITRRCACARSRRPPRARGRSRRGGSRART